MAASPPRALGPGAPPEAAGAVSAGEAGPREASGGEAGAARRRRPPAWLRDLGLVLLCVAGAVVSLRAPSTPTYDPWSWIVWGREVGQLDLNTLRGPSWKPLPVLFTTVFSGFGESAPELWLVVARAGGLVALLVAYRLTARLVRGGSWPAARVVAPLGGLIAALGLLAVDAFAKTTTLGNSEGLLVAFVLLAVERHLDGHRRSALALLAVAGLLRPEVWPFLAVYGLVLLRTVRRSWPVVVGAGLLLPALWFGPELWGSGQLLRSATRAADPRPDSPAFDDTPWLTILDEARTLLTAPLRVAALVALVLALVGWAVRGRDRAIAVLGLCALAWVGIVAGMTQAGYAGNSRYLVAGVALACVLGGVGIARAGQAVAWLASRARLGPRVAGALAVLTVGGVVAATFTTSHPERHGLVRDVSRLEHEAAVYADLPETIERLGGRAAVLRCGHVYTGNFQIPALAWTLRLHAVAIDFAVREPGVLLRPHPTLGAMIVLPADTSRFRPIAETAHWNVAARCRSGTSQLLRRARTNGVDEQLAGVGAR